MRAESDTLLNSIDMLASRLISAHDAHNASRSGAALSTSRGTKNTKPRFDDEVVFPPHHSEDDVELAGRGAHSPSSQQRIVVGAGHSGAPSLDSEEDRTIRGSGRIQKTVDFKVFEVRE